MFRAPLPVVFPGPAVDVVPIPVQAGLTPGSPVGPVPVNEAGLMSVPGSPVGLAEAVLMSVPVRQVRESEYRYREPWNRLDHSIPFGVDWSK